MLFEVLIGDVLQFLQGGDLGETLAQGFAGGKTFGVGHQAGTHGSQGL